RPPPGEAGELIAERLARARGHHQEDISPRRHRLADRFLVGAEGGEVEGGAEEGGEVASKTPHPCPLSHRTPPNRERGTWLGRFAVLPLLPVRGRAMGEEGRGDEG